MSVQHRARIRTVADYSADFSDMGSCCYPPDHENYDSENPTTPVDEVTYQECIIEGGYFLPEGGLCPDLATKGCCCSCSYVDDFDAFLENPGPNYGNGCPDVSNPLSCYQGGLKDVTLCECNAIGGIWSTSPCSYYYDEEDGTGVGSYLLCDPPETEDIRFPSACCSEYIDGNCANVCNPDECTSLICENPQCQFQCDGVNCCNENGEVCNGVYYEFDNCDDYLPECGNSSGGDFVKRYRNNPNLIIGEELKNMNTRDNELSCCVYKKDSRVICDRTIKSSCDSIGGSFAGFDQNLKSQRCDDSVCTDIKDYISNDKNHISSSVASTWSIGEKVLNLGVYVGTFNVKSRNNPDAPAVFGNIETGYSKDFKPETQKNNPESDDRYAIILYPTDMFNVQMHDYGNRSHNRLLTNSVYTDNTLWDSNENWNVSTRAGLTITNRINNIDDNHWRIPSHDVMSFVYNQINNPEFLVNTTVLDKNPSLFFSGLRERHFYWTSSILPGTYEPTYYIHRGDFVAGCAGGMKHSLRLVLQLKIV